MRKGLLSLFTLLLLLGSYAVSYAQLVRLDPPGAGADEPVKLIFDAKAGNKELVGASKVYMHSGVITDAPDGTAWVNAVGTWGADDGVGALSPVAGEQDVWEITFTPSVRVFYGIEEGTNIYRLAMVFRNAAGTKKATIAPGTYEWGTVAANGDIFVDIATGPYVHISQPANETVFVADGGTFLIQAEASAAVDWMTLSIMEGDAYQEKVKVTEGTGIEYNYAPPASGEVMIKVVASVGGTEVESTMTVEVAQYNAPEVAALPAGLRKGINYDPADPTKATLVLEAPGKDFVYVVGDFTNWSANNNYLMNVTPDGELFWLELNGLTAGQEYAFQYWVEGNVKIGDPYADKVADPWNDSGIPETTYPDLLSYNKTEYGVATVLQTGQEAYTWAATEASWTAPQEKELVIYELLVRDFLGSRNYQDLIDTLPYLQRLGINAIELLPIMEFEGNNSWGYNPMYLFAPDKYYGTKNDLKQFVEAAHQHGMAVILDMVLNHAFGQSPLVKLYWDEAADNVSAESPWFNQQPTHPFNVGYDFNHESPYTQAYVDSVNTYWLEEYHFDGFRFDLSKGFTQTNNPDNVNAWSAYDASRISILKRMADEIWENNPDAYVILEHLAVNQEEKELAEYRADEGKGMLLWGVMNHNYGQNTLGYTADSDVSWVYHGTRGWNAPHVVGYMESHDEERLMVKKLNHGNSAGNYDVKDLSTALERIKAAGLFFYTVPGPKMLWQFGELGYDVSINACENGTVNNNCRTAPKPVLWEYRQNPERKSLYDFTAGLLRLRNTYDVFTSGIPSFEGGNSLVKQLTIQNAANSSAPSDAGEMNVKIVANFDVTAKTATVSFPHTGTWYEYYNGGKAIEVNVATQEISLAPGAYKMYTDYPIETPIVSGVSKEQEVGLKLFPNPAENILNLDLKEGRIQQLNLLTLRGATIVPERVAENQWDISKLSTGFYIAEVLVAGKKYHVKILKK